jgi:hypothetical protein
MCSYLLVSGLTFDHFGHYPMVLAESACSLKPLTLKKRNCPIIKKRSGNRSAFYVLGIAFNDSTSEPGDFVQSSFKGNESDAFTAIIPVNKKAGDPPVWKLSETVLIISLELDAWKFICRSKLAPANGGRTVVRKSGVRAAIPDSTLLLRPVLHYCLGTSNSLLVKGHTPTAAPYPVVFFDQPREIRPGAFIQRFHGKIGHLIIPDFIVNDKHTHKKRAPSSLSNRGFAFAEQ